MTLGHAYSLDDLSRTDFDVTARSETHKLCGRCGRTVPASEYSSGRPAVPATPRTFVQTGWQMTPVPVFRHGGGPTPCHPVPVGMVEQPTRTGYYTGGKPGTPAVEWAPGCGTGDHGCHSCRAVAEARYRARAKHARLMSEKRDLEIPSELVRAANRSYLATTGMQATLIWGGILLFVLVIAHADPGAYFFIGYCWFCVMVGMCIKGRKERAAIRGQRAALSEREQHRADELPSITQELRVTEREPQRLERDISEHERRQRAMTAT